MEVSLDVNMCLSKNMLLRRMIYFGFWKEIQWTSQTGFNFHLQSYGWLNSFI